MSTANIIYSIGVILLILVLVTWITNLFQVFAESRRYKAAGKTPLIGKNVVTVTAAAIAEFLIVWLFIWGYLHFGLNPDDPVKVAILFLFPFFIRNAGAYLAAWAVWAAFLHFEKKKKINEIKKDQEEALK